MYPINLWTQIIGGEGEGYGHFKFHVSFLKDEASSKMPHFLLPFREKAGLQQGCAEQTATQLWKVRKFYSIYLLTIRKSGAEPGPPQVSLTHCGLGVNYQAL